MLPFSVSAHVFKKEGVNIREQPPNTWLCYRMSHPVATESRGRTGQFGVGAGVGVAFVTYRTLLGSYLGFRPVEKDCRNRSYSHNLSLNGTFSCFFPPVENVKSHQQSFEVLSLGFCSIACNTSLTES